MSKKRQGHGKRQFIDMQQKSQQGGAANITVETRTDGTTVGEFSKQFVLRIQIVSLVGICIFFYLWDNETVRQYKNILKAKLSFSYLARSISQSFHTLYSVSYCSV